MRSQMRTMVLIVFNGTLLDLATGRSCLARLCPRLIMTKLARTPHIIRGSSGEEPQVFGRVEVPILAIL